MNYEQIKSLEASIISVLKSHGREEMILWLDQCFAAKRVENLQENQIKRLQGGNDSLEKEIRRHKTCISNLRGYIDYLEKEKDSLEQQIDQ